MIPERVVLPPYEVVEVQLKYTPSNIKSLEFADIKLSSTVLGDWTFKLKGKGLPPTMMDITEIAAAVGESNSA
jgi:hypothetical protein